MQARKPLLTAILLLGITGQATCLQIPSSGHYNTKLHRWISTTSGEELQDLIGPDVPDVIYLKQDAVHGVLFGDSNDRNLVNDHCSKEEPRPPQHQIHSVRSCWHNNLTLTWQPMIGVHPTGPYWQGLKGSPAERIDHGLQVQVKTFQSPPDFAIFTSNFWDLWAWADLQPDVLENNQVRPAELEMYAENLSKALTHIEANVPEDTMLVYRLGAPGSWGQCPNPDGSPTTPFLGITENHLDQMNVAARRVLTKHPRWHLMDLQVLLADFECPQEYLRDAIHFNPHITWNILNIYMNTLRKLWKMHGEPPWRRR